MSDIESPNGTVLRFAAGTIELRPHPEDLIEVEPEILASMTARLNGISLDTLYCDTERVSSELLLRTETQKIRSVIQDYSYVKESYQSVAGTNALRNELNRANINRTFLAEYAFKKAGFANVDEFDLLGTLLNGYELISKGERMIRVRRLSSIHGTSGTLIELLNALKIGYMEKNLEPLRITKEISELEPMVRELVLSGRAVETMNMLLEVFYGGMHG
jgi:hypothetical protein